LSGHLIVPSLLAVGAAKSGIGDIFSVTKSFAEPEELPSVDRCGATLFEDGRALMDTG
jgi:hypothetical protein